MVVPRLRILPQLRQATVEPSPRAFYRYIKHKASQGGSKMLCLSAKSHEELPRSGVTFKKWYSFGFHPLLLRRRLHTPTTPFCRALLLESLSEEASQHSLHAHETKQKVENALIARLSKLRDEGRNKRRRVKRQSQPVQCFDGCEKKRVKCTPLNLFEPESAHIADLSILLSRALQLSVPAPQSRTRGVRRDHGERATLNVLGDRHPRLVLSAGRLQPATRSQSRVLRN